MHVFVSMCVCVCVRVCVRVRVRARVSLCVHVCACASMHVSMYACARVCVTYPYFVPSVIALAKNELHGMLKMLYRVYNLYAPCICASM